HRRDALAHDGMIVNDENANHFLTLPLPPSASAFARARGTVTVTVVPRPGALRIVARPPTSRARSSMPTRPNPRRRAPCGRKPAPVSATVKRTEPARRAAVRRNPGAGARTSQPHAAAGRVEPDGRLARRRVLPDVGQRFAG